MTTYSPHVDWGLISNISFYFTWVYGEGLVKLNHDGGGEAYSTVSVVGFNDALCGSFSARMKINLIYFWLKRGQI